MQNFKEMQHRKPPHTKFEIIQNSENKDISKKAKNILFGLLEIHKDFNDRKLNNILNYDACEKTEVSLPTFKYYVNKVLIHKKYLKTKQQPGTNFIKYYFNWRKLRNSGFIKDHPKTDIKTVKTVSKTVLKSGTEITIENCKKFKDDIYYDFKFYNLENNKISGSGIETKLNGKKLKGIMKMQHRNYNAKYFAV